MDFKLIYNEICNGKSKHAQGYTHPEIAEILNKYNVKDFEGGVHTCVVIDGEIVSYKYDVAQDVCNSLIRQNEKP